MYYIHANGWMHYVFSIDMISCRVDRPFNVLFVGCGMGASRYSSAVRLPVPTQALMDSFAAVRVGIRWPPFIEFRLRRPADAAFRDGRAASRHHREAFSRCLRQGAFENGGWCEFDGVVFGLSTGDPVPSPRRLISDQCVPHRFGQMVGRRLLHPHVDS